MSQRLGEILLAHGTIDAGQLQAALAHQQAHGEPLGDALVALRICTGDQVLAALAAQAGLPPIDLDKEKVDRSLTRFFTPEMADWYRAVPLWFGGGILGIAIGAPASPDLLEEIRARTAPSGVRRLSPFMASDKAIARALSRLHGERHGERHSSCPTVQLYGWPEDVAGMLLAGLSAHQVPGRVVTDEAVKAARPEDIILAPIPAMEALLGQHQRCEALLIAASRRAEDFPRAERLGACGFLLAPLDMDCVVRAIQRCHQILGLSPRLAGAA